MGIVVATTAVVATGTVVDGTAATVVVGAGTVVATGTGEEVELLANVVEEPASSVVVVGITPCSTRESSW